MLLKEEQRRGSGVTDKDSIYGLKQLNSGHNVCTSSQQNRRSTLIWIQSLCVYYLLLLKQALEDTNFTPFYPKRGSEYYTEFWLLLQFCSCSITPYGLGITNPIMVLEPNQCSQGTILWLTQETLFLVYQGQISQGFPWCLGYNRIHTHLLLPASSQFSKGGDFHVGNHRPGSKPLWCCDKLLGVDNFKRAFRTFHSCR